MKPAILVALLLAAGQVQAQALAPCATERPTLAEACADPWLETPTCDDDVLRWDPVPDADLLEYLVEEFDLEGVPRSVAHAPAGHEALAIGCRDEPRVFKVWAVDTSGNQSPAPAACLYEPDLIWDCVVESRPECAGACSEVCLAWSSCAIAGKPATCCTEIALEPPGCQLCPAPIGGADIWARQMPVPPPNPDEWGP